jgi:hypothetical protein
MLILPLSPSYPLSPAFPSRHQAPLEFIIMNTIANSGPPPPHPESFEWQSTYAFPEVFYAILTPL